MSRFLAHTQLDPHKYKHTTGKTPLNEWSARRKGLYDIQQTKGTHINGIIGIRAGDTSNRVTADPRLKMHCLRHRLESYLVAKFREGITKCSKEISMKLTILTFCWPCISVYLSHYLTNLMHKICFTISYISCLYMFRAHVLIIRRSKLHYTASGIITLKHFIYLSI